MSSVAFSVISAIIAVVALIQTQSQIKLSNKHQLFERRLNNFFAFYGLYELYKENAVLIKVKNGGYVDLENFNSILDYIKIHQDITKNGYRLGGLIMSTSAHCINSLFVDRKSLIPYYKNKEQDNNISVHQLKKQINNNSNK